MWLVVIREIKSLRKILENVSDPIIIKIIETSNFCVYCVYFLVYLIREMHEKFEIGLSVKLSPREMSKFHGWGEPRNLIPLKLCLL